MADIIQKEKSSTWLPMVFFCSVLAGGLTVGAEVVVHPVDDGRALVNPGMGWTMHYYSNIPHNYGSQLEPGDRKDAAAGMLQVDKRAVDDPERNDAKADL